ncbi:MAG: G-D-S-L family lipolytic protein [Bacteroidota bacterium]
MKRFIGLFAFFGLLAASCSDDDNSPQDPGGTDPDPVAYSSGSADFATYVAVGNSLTAGFSDGALFASGQAASFPNMLATSFAEAGGGAFNIPFMADDLGGATLAGNTILDNRFILSFATGSPSPTRLDGTPSTEISTVLTNGPFNNMGVPGAKSYHLLAPNYGNVQGVESGAANPYYVRFAAAPQATILADAIAQSATFFTLWVGNNDILGYATAGGAGINQLNNLDPSTYGGNDISDPNVVAGSINTILENMTANGAGGAIANLPDVTTIPYFSAVPYNPVALDPDTAALLNNAFMAYNQGLAAIQQQGAISADEMNRRTISFSAGEGNPVVLIDEDLTDLTGINPALTNMRQATEADLLVLPASTFIGTPVNDDPTMLNGISVPLTDQWVLTPEEQQAVVTATTAYNASIEALATQYDIAFVDANSFLRSIAENGFPLADGSTVTAVFATGGGFSLDGVHPSPRGYALLANLFIDAIEEKYQAVLPRADPLEFTGLYID